MRSEDVNLKVRRKAMKLSQAELAVLLGTTKTTIVRNEKKQGEKHYSPIANPIMFDLALQTIERQHKKNGQTEND